MNTSPPSILPGYGQTDGTPRSQFRSSYDSPASGSSSSAAPRAGKPGARQITRNRASYSCHTCRRRKVKCDKVHPICGNCVKNDTECVYDAAPQKDTESRASISKNGHGVKRRRESSRPIEEDIDDIQSIYGHLKQSGASEQRSQAIEARLDKLTSMIERLSKTNQPVDLAGKQRLAPNVKLEPAEGDPRLTNIAAMKPAAGSRSDSPRRAAESSGDEFPIPAGHATDLVDPVGSLNLGHLSLEDGGRSRDQNRSHNELPFNESPVDDAGTEPMAATPGRQWKESADGVGETADEKLSRGQTFQKSILFPSSESPSVNDKIVEPEMLENMPTKRQSHILYKGFMSGIHAITPVVHPPTILKLYNSFWDWYDSSSYSGESCPDPSFIPLLYAIWYGGSVTVSIRTIKAEFNIPSRSGLSKAYSEEVTRWLSKISFPRSPSMQGLAAYLLVQTILSKEEEPLTSSLFISLAMRVAQTMGLHRDPAKFGIGPCDAEYRRRIWWHIVHMDGVVAMSSGLPPLVSDENYWDVRETSEVKDTLLGTPAAEKYERLVMTGMRPPDNPDDPTVCGGPSMVNVYYLSARGKYTMARAVRRIMKIQLGTKPVTRRDMEELRSILVDLQYKLNSIINRIPEANSLDTSSPVSSTRSWSLSSQAESRTELPADGPNGCAEQYHSPVLVSFHKWARILMSLFIDKAFCVAYQPFLKNAKSRIWPAARHSALRHCHGFMEKFVSLATDPDFQPFQWSWPGNHQPMHATMIMLIDLYERPYSPEAPKSRAYIDKIFSMTGPDGGVVGGEDGVSTQRPLKDGGREAWDMIRRLRQKAWQKAGLDPQRLWSEQAQIQAGVTSLPEEYANDPCYSSGSPTNAASPSTYPLTTRRQLTDFSKMFYNMTRSHQLPNPVKTNTRPSPLRYQLPPPAPVPILPSPQSRTVPPPFPQSPTPPRYPMDTTTSATSPLPSASPISSPESIPPLNPNIFPTTFNNTPQLAVNTPPPPPMPQSAAPPPLPSFMDTAISPTSQPITGVPTPPSMVDPNLNFDWDQWDAVFGQHLPVADELMELDPVTGFEFGDLGGSSAATTATATALNSRMMSGGAGRGSFGSVGSGPTSSGNEAEMGEVRGPDWVGYC
ncbi:hypothetical protein AbraIFM66951_006456 [Aspergillus brasiliensis]|nr:hypothetical protein AbraIFM66951_006456 [Aspergillus brasiliensis]